MRLPVDAKDYPLDKAKRHPSAQSQAKSSSFRRGAFRCRQLVNTIRPGHLWIAVRGWRRSKLLQARDCPGENQPSKIIQERQLCRSK